MVIHLEEAKPKKPASDLVNEARAVLTKCAPGGKITNGADAYLFDVKAPRILSQLCDELDQQVSLNKTQAESLAFCHDRMKLQKGAIEAAAESLLAVANQLDEWARQSLEGGWSTHQVDPMRKTADALRRKASGLTAKGEKPS